MSRLPHGYAGRILTVDLSSRTTGELSTQEYAPGFVGGRGSMGTWGRVSFFFRKAKKLTSTVNIIKMIPIQIPVKPQVIGIALFAVPNTYD